MAVTAIGSKMALHFEETLCSSDEANQSFKYLLEPYVSFAIECYDWYS